MCAGTALTPPPGPPALPTPSPRAPLKPSFQRRALAYGQFLLSAIGVSLAVHVALLDAWLGGLLAVGVVAIAVPQLRARRRMKQLLSSGDVAAILDLWSDTVRELPNFRTTAPLARATALVTHGFTERATTSLDRAQRGGAWDRALEHRLFIETLVEAFEGRSDKSLQHALELRKLPLPASLWARSRANTLRNAAVSLARSFGHCAQAGDLNRLAAAGQHHPLVYWAMRYAQAVICLDQGKAGRALRLIEKAPAWEEESVFYAFQIELFKVAQTALDS